MTGRPQPEDERDLDTWVEEATDGWRMPPPAAADRIPWQARIATTPSSRWGLPWPSRRRAVGALGAGAVIAIALVVLTASLPTGTPVAPGNDVGGSARPTEHSSTAPPIATTRDELFRVTIRADKARYEANEPIVITTTLEYTGRAGETTVTGSGGGLVAFLIEQLDGPIDTGGDRDDSCNQYRFRRGDVESIGFQKSGGYSPQDPTGDFWRRFFDDPQLRLPAGTYRITAQAEYGPPRCAPTQQVAASVVIEVVEPPIATDSDERFRITIQSVKLRYEANEPIAVHATLEYIGQAEATTITSTYDGPVYFGIEQLDGPIDMGPAMRTSCVTYRYRSDHSETIAFQKSGGFDGSDALADFWSSYFADPQLRLPRGEYRVFVVVPYSLRTCGGESTSWKPR